MRLFSSIELFGSLADELELFESSNLNRTPEKQELLSLDAHKVLESSLKVLYMPKMLCEIAII